MSDLAHYAKLLGGEVSCNQIRAPGPGHSSADRSLSVWFIPGSGFVVHSFADDGFQECRDYVKSKLGINPDYEPHVRLPEPTLSKPSNRFYVSGILENSVPISCTAAESYLVSRGIYQHTVRSTKALEYHPACPFKGRAVPAMVAAMLNVKTGQFQGIHRTSLNPKDKAMLGQARGSAVMLSPFEDVLNGLFICEGIETGLAVLGAGIAPVWACMSASGIANFPVLSGIGSLSIIADHDDAGINAARKCAARWVDAGREIRIFTPPAIGFDFLDWRSA